jgi:hypothetical protein
MGEEVAKELEIMLVQIQTRTCVRPEPAHYLAARQTSHMAVEGVAIGSRQCPRGTACVLARREFDVVNGHDP